MQLLKSVLCTIALIPALAFAAPVTFVATDTELNQALVLRDNDEIESLAIAQRFYVESAKQTKSRIRGLAAGLTGVAGKGVYMYGAPFDPQFGTELVNTGGAVLCEPVVIVGTLFRERGSAHMCTGTSKKLDEVELREMVTELNNDNRSR